MELYVSTARLFPECETDAAAEKIISSGADGAEISLNTFYEYRPEFAKSLKARLGNFRVCGIRVMRLNFEAQLFSPSRRVRGDGFYWLDQVMRSAQLLGCDSYIFSGAQLPLNTWRDFDDAAGYMREIIGFCARYGVKLCLENCAEGLYSRPWIFSELRARIPELIGAPNMAEARLSGYPFSMYLQDMRGSIACVSLVDWDKNGNTCAAGLGVYDYKKLISDLKLCGFDGNLVARVDSGSLNGEYVPFLRGKLQ